MKRIFNSIADFIINIKNKVINIIKIIIKIIKNRFNQDCLGKRLWSISKQFLIDLKIQLNFQARRDILPFMGLIFAKLYLSLIFYISLLDILSIN